jgi:hypothetical protein
MNLIFIFSSSNTSFEFSELFFKAKCKLGLDPFCAQHPTNKKLTTKIKLKNNTFFTVNPF